MKNNRITETPNYRKIIFDLIPDLLMLDDLDINGKELPSEDEDEGEDEDEDDFEDDDEDEDGEENGDEDEDEGEDEEEEESSEVEL